MTRPSGDSGVTCQGTGTVSFILLTSDRRLRPGEAAGPRPPADATLQPPRTHGPRVPASRPPATAAVVWEPLPDTGRVAPAALPMAPRRPVPELRASVFSPFDGVVAASAGAGDRLAPEGSTGPRRPRIPWAENGGPGRGRCTLPGRNPGRRSRGGQCRRQGGRGHTSGGQREGVPVGEGRRGKGAEGQGTGGASPFSSRRL